MGEPAGVGGETTLTAWLKHRDTLPCFFAIDDIDRLSAINKALGLAVPLITAISTSRATRPGLFAEGPAGPPPAASGPPPFPAGPTPPTHRAVCGAIELGRRAGAGRKGLGDHHQPDPEGHPVRCGVHPPRSYGIPRRPRQIADPAGDDAAVRRTAGRAGHHPRQPGDGPQDPGHGNHRPDLGNHRRGAENRFRDRPAAPGHGRSQSPLPARTGPWATRKAPSLCRPSKPCAPRAST